MADNSYDVVVIGAGPGGYVAAIRAAQLGLKTAVVEREHLGGVCLNWGCIPTKALLRTAEAYHMAQNLGAYGLAADNLRFDVKKIVKRSRDVAARLNAGVKHLLKKNKVTVIDGAGALGGPGKVTVSRDGKAAEELSAKNIILATGARARQIPGLESDGKRVWSYREAMLPEAIPASLLVVGSGAIGMEFASFFRTMGSEVTVVEVLTRVLPVEDEEISALARKAFEKQGMKIHTGASVMAMRRGVDKVTATIDLGGGKKTEIQTERVIMAVGITGNVENLGLEAAGVKTNKGHVVVNEWCETGVAGVYAIGDIAHC